MFERRLRILLYLIALMGAALMARAAQIQLFEKNRWAAEASKLTTRRTLLETTRGRIVDIHGVVLAEDEACMDAAVDYPAITEDWDQYKDWLHTHAIASATRRLGPTFTKSTGSVRSGLVEAETIIVRNQVEAMWYRLASVSGKTPDEIDAIRQDVERRVELRRQYVQWQNYQKALEKQKGSAATTRPWYERFLPAASSVDGPRLDDYAVEVGDQTTPHVILSGIDTNQYNELAREAENMPGLVLQPGRKRVYPLGDVACHILGHLTPVTPEQLAADANRDDPLRALLPSDLSGQTGVERLCEPLLRGTRGEIRTSAIGNDTGTTDPVPGHDVALTIDAQLQRAIEQSFAARRVYRDPETEETSVRQNQPGAAVVIDIATGQVRALVSYPTFDLNHLDENYEKLSRDDLNTPLVNKATQIAAEPGSTVKPLMGLSAMADGLITPETTIECNGYLVLDGHQYDVGKCWTVREFAKYIGTPEDPRHHKIPTEDPHPTGFLTVTDAIERSCNVFFETVADRMKMDRQRYWYDRFGLGRPTGIGLPEAWGRIPNPAHAAPAALREMTWFAGIGQGDIQATPLQMANVAATIARDGVWMRPSIVTQSGAVAANGPDRIDLGFSPQSLQAVKEGMFEVVNKRAGTGRMDPVDSIVFAGKTGTPQVGRLTVPVRDDQGRIVMEDGREKRQLVDPADPAVATWYIGTGPTKTDYAHAWFIGYAPADHPKIAFAVFVWYGGAGGSVAGSIVHDMLDACVKTGNLPGGTGESANAAN
ncbi:MAG: penicillin-binding transpeptidase domain-containing protein [Tepidisphaeraceae bacterium]